MAIDYVEEHIIKKIAVTSRNTVRYKDSILRPWNGEYVYKGLPMEYVVYYQFTTFEGKSLDIPLGILQAKAPAYSIEKLNTEILHKNGVSLSPNKNATFYTFS